VSAATLTPDTLNLYPSVSWKEVVVNNDDDPSDIPELAEISTAQEFARWAKLLLESPRMKASQGDSGHYETVLGHSNLILHLVEIIDGCRSAEEFDVLLNLICCNAEGLARAFSLLRIP
jgi:hypothetical protein